MANDTDKQIDFSVDRKNLYHEDIYTDLRVGSIRRLTPVNDDGTVDKSRKTLYVGQTSLMTPNGSIPIQAVIQAKELQQAIKRFPEAMRAAMDRLMEEAQKLKEQEKEKKDSRIIVPGR